MERDMAKPATQADVQYLAELVTQNALRMEGMEGKMEGLEERMEGLEERMEGLESRLEKLEIQMMDGFLELKNMISGIGKYLTNHEERIAKLEMA